MKTNFTEPRTDAPASQPPPYPPTQSLPVDTTAEPIGPTFTIPRSARLKLREGLTKEEQRRIAKTCFFYELEFSNLHPQIRMKLVGLYRNRLPECTDSLEYLKGSGVTLADFSHLHKASVSKLQRYLMKHYGFEIP